MSDAELTASVFASASENGGDLAAKRLPDAGPSLEVAQFAPGPGGRPYSSCSLAHRHDYHELIWMPRGIAEHEIDGSRVEVGPQTLTVIGRGQVHLFRRADSAEGVVVAFGEELLHGGTAGGSNPAWLVGRTGLQSVQVPDGDVARVHALIESLAAEAERPLDGRSVELHHHLLVTLLLWLERWYDASLTDVLDGRDADVLLYRRFVDLLERDFSRHHDVGHYAEQLHVPASVLARALSSTNGRATKALIADRVMLEAARLLRFTDMQVGEIAYRVGFDDQFYFSHAFKRHYGEAPATYRERLRGRAEPASGQ